MTKYDKIRQAAEEAKQEVLESYFQPLVTQAFNDLCEWLPNRKISLVWGMGLYYLKIQRKGKQHCIESNAIYDTSGYTENSITMREGMRESFLNTPLYILVELLEQCHDEEGKILQLKNLESSN